MSASQSSLLESGSTSASAPHFHAIDEACPLCEQPIPHKQFEEIKERIRTREHELSANITARLHEQFAIEKTEALERVQQDAAAALSQEQEAGAARTALAREEVNRAAQFAAQEQLATVNRANQEAQAEMLARIEQAEVSRNTAEQAGTALQAQLEQVLRDSDASIQKIKQDAIANEAVSRADARHLAELAVQDKLADMERVRQAAETALQVRIQHSDAEKLAAVEICNSLQDQLNQMRHDNETAIDKIKLDAAARETIVRQEAQTSVAAAMQNQIAEARQAQSDAEMKAASAEQQSRALQEAYEVQLNQRLQEQREALEQAQTVAVNAEKSAAFEEKQKLSLKLEDLQRALDKKTAEELGEGAEIDLYELLKGEFEKDRIERIHKGLPGADIRHVVIHNGKECGTIIYDSKNHNAWRNEFVTKLATDQMAAKAEHAILATRKFPAGARQLHVQDGVILVSPARAIALVQVVRQHLIQNYTLRLSNEARTQKTAMLYCFITSERCMDLFSRIDSHAEDLLELQIKEKKAHEATWKRQGELARSVQKVRAELCNEIDTIIGTAQSYEQSPHE